MEKSRKELRNIGIAIIVISGVIMFGNGMGLLAFSIIPSDVGLQEDPIFSKFQYIAGTSFTLATGLFISGIFIRKFKNWARLMGQFFALLIFLGIWTTTIFIGTMDDSIESEFSLFPYITAAFWSFPVILLIIYLNKSNTKDLFRKQV